MTHDLSHHRGIQTVHPSHKELRMAHSGMEKEKVIERFPRKQGGSGETKRTQTLCNKLCNFLSFGRCTPLPLDFMRLDHQNEPMHASHMIHNRNAHFYIQSHFGITLILQYMHTRWVSIYSSSLQRHLCHICTAAFGFSWTNIWGLSVHWHMWVFTQYLLSQSSAKLHWYFLSICRRKVNIQRYSFLVMQMHLVQNILMTNITYNHSVIIIVIIVLYHHVFFQITLSLLWQSRLQSVQTLLWTKLKTRPRKSYEGKMIAKIKF